MIYNNFHIHAHQETSVKWHNPNSYMQVNCSVTFQRKHLAPDIQQALTLNFASDPSHTLAL